MTVLATRFPEEHFLRWELPLTRGWGYYHAIRVEAGDRFRWPGVRTAAERLVAERVRWALEVCARRRRD